MIFEQFFGRKEEKDTKPSPYGDAQPDVATNQSTSGEGYGDSQVVEKKAPVEPTGEQLYLQEKLLGETHQETERAFITTRDQVAFPDKKVAGACQFCGGSGSANPYNPSCPYCGNARENYYIRVSETVPKPQTQVVEKVVEKIVEKPLPKDGEINLAPGEEVLSFKDGVLRLRVTKELPSGFSKVTLACGGETVITGEQQATTNKMVVIVESKASDGTKVAAYEKYREAELVGLNLDGKRLDISAGSPDDDEEEDGGGNMFGNVRNVIIGSNMVVVNGKVISGGGSSRRESKSAREFVRVIKTEMTLPANTALAISEAGELSIKAVKGEIKVSVARSLKVEDFDVLTCDDGSNTEISKGNSFTFTDLAGESKISDVGVVDGSDASGTLTVIRVGSCDIGDVSGSKTFANVGLLKIGDMSGQTSISSSTVDIGSSSGMLNVSDVKGKIRSTSGMVNGKSSCPGLTIGKSSGMVN